MQGEREKEPVQAWNCPQIFEKTMLQAAASLALKVSARNTVGKVGSLCQEVRGCVCWGGMGVGTRGPFHIQDPRDGGGRVPSHSGPPSHLLIP